MNCLVIGGTGFIGSHITRKLVSEGFNVVTFSRSGNTANVSDVLDKIKVTIGSTLEINALIDVIKGYNTKLVVYAAAEHPPWTPLNVVRTMIVGFMNVLEACRLMDVERFVWTSSYAQLGPPELYPTERVNEDAPVKPQALHGPSFVCNEYFAKEYVERYGLDVITLRLGINFGPGRRRIGFHDFVVELFENPILGKPVRLAGGDARYTLQYVKDTAEAVYTALKASGIKHRVFNTCDEVVSLRQLAEYVKEEVPAANITIEPGGRTERALVDASRIREELGFKPRFGIRGGVKDYINELKRTVFAR